MIFRGYKVAQSEKEMKEANCPYVIFSCTKDRISGMYYDLNKDVVGNIPSGQEFDSEEAQCICNDELGCTCGAEKITSKLMCKLREEEKNFVIKNNISMHKIKT